MPNRFLVTGGSGFLGVNVLRALVDHPDVDEIVNVDRCPPPVELEPVRTCIADVGDAAAMATLVHGVDRVIHLAADSNVDAIDADPTTAVQNNVGATAGLLEAARRVGVERFVFASTAWVYMGVDPDEVDESTPCYPPGPTNLYASTKLAGELICRAYAAQFRVPTTILRFSTPYGPFMRPELVVRRFLEKALRGETLTIGGDGRTMRNFVYAADLADGVVRGALSDRAVGQTYNLAGPRPVSIKELAETICHLVPGDVGITHTEGRTADFSGARLSIDAARRDLGWHPDTDLTTGIGKTLSWLRAHRGFDT